MVLQSFQGAVTSTPFSISVDESAVGPVVVTVRGEVSERQNSRLFAECLAEAVRAGRPLVIDLLGTHSLDRTSMAFVADTAFRLSHKHCRTTIACTPALATLRSFTEARQVHVDFVDSVDGWRGSAIPIVSTDALRGTYL